MWEQGEQFFNEKISEFLKHLLLDERVSLLVCQMSAIQLTWYSNRSVRDVSSADLLKRMPS